MIADLDTVLTALYVELPDRIIASLGLARSGPGHSRWYWGAKLLLIVTCDGTVTGFALANPKLAGEREQARTTLERQPANRPAPGTTIVTDSASGSR